MSRVLLIGDVVVDVTLRSKQQETKLRMGGIVHAARGLWAQNIPYSVGYIAPSYLDDQIRDYLKAHDCEEVVKIGEVTGAPYIFLIQEPKEIGNQGYEFLLREEIKIEYIYDNISYLAEKELSDTLLISGNYDLADLISRLPGKIHMDVANNVGDLEFFKNLEKKVSSLFISTSSAIFQKYYKNNFLDFANIFKTYVEKLILKENRGGSRGFVFETNELFSAASQTAPIQHSVGVGDVFDTCFISNQPTMSSTNALVLSSWIAYEYASTSYPDDFKKGVERTLKSDIAELAKLGGVSLTWEERKDISIYIAAPDFDHVDKTPIDLLENSLLYHNFRPRRPIVENGLMEKGASKTRKQELFEKDMTLLGECSMLVAVLLYNDPGTLIEIGLASARGIPTMVYDPYNQAENCMLTELPNLISDDLDEIISEVFIESAKIKNNEK
ncbi:nucleoside 2-deoxyribosyltransferase [Pedobacter sp. R20-19]|uniref:nucleoside 2-deoxyribosyltransferase n=1 Tax=Pedobacter sp. R20-19 TaxID=1270196 RepID=UPI0004939DBF|nr:nucleoside 2-deoxyribosyltransferase [Pedobacter sp. R20-19]